MSVKKLKKHIEQTRAAAIAAKEREEKSQEAATERRRRRILASLNRQSDAIAAMLLKALKSGQKSVSHAELAATFLKGHKIEDTYQSHELDSLIDEWLKASGLDSHFKSSTPDYDSWGICLKN